MQTTLRSAFITDLLLPPANSLPTLPPALITQIGHTTALTLLLDAEAFIRLNPLVTAVRPISSPSQSKHYIDIPYFCAEFGINSDGDSGRGIAGEWRQYEITDKLNYGLGSKDLVYATAMRRIPGGFESVTNPGSGVRIYGRFEVLRPSELGRVNDLATNSLVGQPQLEEGAARGDGVGNGTHGEVEGVVHYVEHNETRCNALLGVYIKATNSKSHREMHEGFKRKWGEEVKRRLQEEVAKEGGVTQGSRPGSALGERRAGSAQGAGMRKLEGEGGRTGSTMR